MEELEDESRQGPQEVRHHRRSGRAAEDRRFAQVRRPDRPTAKVLGWVKDNAVGNAGQLAGRTTRSALLLDRTNFYAEQGGQVGDTRLDHARATGRFEVDDTQKLGDGVLHLGRVDGGHDRSRPARRRWRSTATAPHTMRNHTATHLLNWALRKVLGEHIEQKGSLVDADKTRFDFTHDKPLTADEIAEVERLVNEKIYADLPVTPVTMPLAEAKKICRRARRLRREVSRPGARAADRRRDSPSDATPEHSVEFCGGTHLHHTGQAGFFKIVGQEAVAKGVRRVTAVTGREAVATVQQLSAVRRRADRSLQLQAGGAAAPHRGAAGRDQEAADSSSRRARPSDLAGAGDKLFADADRGQRRRRSSSARCRPAPVEQMRQQLDRLRQKAGSAVIVLGWADEGKVRPAGRRHGRPGQEGAARGQAGRRGGEGGRRQGRRPADDMAQAGGKDADKLAEALQLAKKLAIEKLSG